MNQIKQYKNLFRSYDSVGGLKKLSLPILYEILESINWSMTMPQFLHIEETLNDLKSLSQLTESEYESLFVILTDLAYKSQPGYGHDFPQDYIGIGGDLL